MRCSSGCASGRDPRRRPPGQARPDRAAARPCDAGRGRAADGRRVARAGARWPGGGRPRARRLPGHLFGAEQVFERLLAALGPRDVALGVFRFAEPSRSDVLELDGAAVTRVHVRPQQPASNLVWGCFAARRSALDGIEVSMSRANSSTGSPVPAAWPRSTSRPSSSTSALRSRCRRRRKGPRHRPPRLHRLGGRAVPCRARHEVTGVGTHYYPAATCTPAPRSRACSATSAISARTTCAATTRSSTWPLSPTDPLDDLDPELTFEINERASVRLARAAREAGVGRFIFASVVLDVRRLGRGVRHRAGPAQPGHALPADRAHRGHRAHRGRRARSATRGAKAALLNLTETLAAETAGKGLVVFAISPGFVRTAMHPRSRSCSGSDESRRSSKR